MTVKEEKLKGNPTQDSDNQESVGAHEQAFERVTEARFLVKRYTLYTGGAGLIPIPIVDVASVGALQLKMLKELSDLYDVPFKGNIVRGLISALAGGIGSVALVRGTRGILKSVPVVGSILGGASMGIYSSAMTYAIGRVFIKHFESGGTYLTFNPAKYKEYYMNQFYSAKAQGKTTVA